MSGENTMARPQIGGVAVARKTTRSILRLGNGVRANEKHDFVRMDDGIDAKPAPVPASVPVSVPKSVPVPVPSSLAWVLSGVGTRSPERARVACSPVWLAAQTAPKLPSTLHSLTVTLGN